MTKKKASAVLLAILAVIISLAMPVSAQKMPASLVTSSGPAIQPFWDIADYAELYLYFSDGKAFAELDYSAPSAASASMKVTIYYKAPGSSSWIRAASSSSDSASCTAKSGYQYKAEATLTLTMNGIKEVIPLSDGPYTA